jgi:predicted nuclease of predicted toxin-antitoxin system
MRFLADENCDFGVVKALRLSGYDVLSVSELSRRADDEMVVRLALQTKRILLTEDKDFGQLVYAQGKRCQGVIFIRYPTSARRQLAQDVVALVKMLKEKLMGAFVIVQPGRIRIARIPKKK